MTIVNMHEAKSQLSRLVSKAEDGEEVVIARDGRPVVRLVPVVPGGQPRTPGRWRDLLWMAHDIDAPLPADMQAAFEGTDE